MKGTAALLLFDSVAEAAGSCCFDCVVVTGSHGGTSAGRYAQALGARLVVFNDAGGGKDDAGISALAMLQARGLAACAVSSASARIGEARSTLDDGVVSHANAAALALGIATGAPLRELLKA
jgi:hypothetical protein